MDFSWRTASVDIDEEMIEMLGTTVKLRFQNDIADSFEWNRPWKHFPSLKVFLGDEVVYYNHFEWTSDGSINMDFSWRTASVDIDEEMIEMLGTTVKLRF